MFIGKAPSMTREIIFQKVQAAIKNTMRDIDTDLIRMGTHIRDDLGADSVDRMSLLIALEEEFDDSIPIEHTTEISTVEQIVGLIEAALYSG
jgi:acyl carrier protein